VLIFPFLLHDRTESAATFWYHFPSLLTGSVIRKVGKIERICWKQTIYSIRFHHM